MLPTTQLTVDEASELLKVNSVTVYRNIRNGSLKATRKGKSYLITLSDLISFLDKKNQLKNDGDITTPKKAKPFLKWAGGKRQLAGVLSERIPNNITGSYYEPFLGGGALYFHLKPKKAKLSDSNAELINAYIVVRDKVEELIESFGVHKNTEEYYYQMRSKDYESLNDVERASRTIYLNRTCFNGLYRVNKKGFFNVPYGKKTGEFKYDAENLRLASDFLQNADLYVSDYKEALKGIGKKDFVYLDPPYYPIGGYSDFQRYTKECFGENDHEELSNTFDRLSKRGVRVIQSNSNTDYILNRYSNYKIDIVDAKRLISSKASSRSSKDVIIYSQNTYAK